MNEYNTNNNNNSGGDNLDEPDAGGQTSKEGRDEVHPRTIQSNCCQRHDVGAGAGTMTTLKVMRHPESVCRCPLRLKLE